MSAKRLAAVVTLAGLLLTAAPATAMASTPSVSTRPVPVSTRSVSALDTAFLDAVHQANLTEIAGSGIAADKGKAAGVRALGARFVRDHKKMDAELAAVAQGLGVTLPDTPTADQLALVKKYQATDGVAFDKLFLRTQLSAHRGALAACREELANGENAQVKDLVKAATPIVMRHRDAIAAEQRRLGFLRSATPGHH